MTRVGFYVVKSTEAQQRLLVAARLAGKAFQAGHRVYIHTDSEHQAVQMDELLWSFRPGSFVPHGLNGSGDDDLVAIGWQADVGNHDDLLINMDLKTPGFFSRFNRVAEVVTQDEKSLAALRQAWTFYKDRGYQLEKHDI